MIIKDTVQINKWFMDEKEPIKIEKINSGKINIGYNCDL